jgi:AcrR family transcriptional regulator
MAYRETLQVRQRKDAQRQAILDAARRLVSKGGFREAQMAAVATEAGVATGTLYRYFPNQADLLTALFRAVSQRELDAMAEAVAGEAGAKQRLENAILTVSERALRNRKLAYALLGEPLHPHIEGERLRFRRAFAKTLEQLIDSGIETRELPTQDAKVTAAALVGAMGEALLGPLARGGPSTRQAFVDSLLMVCLRATGAH